MKFSVDDAEELEVDEGLVIKDLFDGEDFAFDFVIADLDGDHPTVVNHESDRAYYVLEGSGKVKAGEEKFRVSPGDLVKIPSGRKHTIKGDLKYIVVTGPPFDPSSEEVIDD